MNTNLLNRISTLLIALFCFACEQTPRGDQAAVTDRKTAANGAGEAYQVDTQASSIAFTGNGVGKNHPGVFRLDEGMLTVADGQVTGGQFTIDINSMELTETGDAIQNRLRPHLLSPDFFDVANHPTARFEITHARMLAAEAGAGPVRERNLDGIANANYEIGGNLTLRDSTKNVTFPAHIQLDEARLTARASFNIDRSQWGMSYGNDQSLGDKFISPTVNIKLELQARK